MIIKQQRPTVNATRIYLYLIDLERQTDLNLFVYNIKSMLCRYSYYVDLLDLNFWVLSSIVRTQSFGGIFAWPPTTNSSERHGGIRRGKLGYILVVQDQAH